MRLFWVLSPVGWGAGIQKHCFLSLPLLPSHAPWWIVYATYLLLHLCCTFRPIIAPTWDCTQDNVGIFDNTDCETETLFWINKQRRLELLERNPRFFPPPAPLAVLLVIWLFLLGLLSGDIWVISEKALSVLDGGSGMGVCWNMLWQGAVIWVTPWMCNTNDIWKDRLHSKHGSPILSAASVWKPATYPYTGAAL